MTYRLLAGGRGMAVPRRSAPYRSEVRHPDGWWYVMPDPESDAWLVTKNGRSGDRYADDEIARRVADRHNGVGR